MADATPAAATPEESVAASFGTAARVDRVDLLSFGLTTIIAFAGYWFTLPPDLTLENSGLMATSAMYAGVPQVPGYPVWTLYSWCFTKLLPFSNIAWRVAVGSAVASALACGLVASVVSHGGRILLAETGGRGPLSSADQTTMRVVCGVATALVLAFANVVWRNAVVVDTWSVSLLLFVGVLASLMRWMFDPAARKFLCLTFFLYGLVLTNSQELLLALPGLVVAIMITDQKLGRDVALFVVPVAMVVTSPMQVSLWIVFPTILNWPLVLAFLLVFLTGLMLACWTRRIGTEWRATLLLGCFMLLGLAFYFYVPIASMTTPPVNWGYARTPEGFFHVLRRGQFERLNPVTDPLRFWGQFWMWVAVAGKKLGWPCLAICLVPFCFLHRLNCLMRRCLVTLAVFWFGVGPLLLAELNPPLDRQAQELIELYFGASYSVLAICMGVGLMILGRLAITWRTGEAD